jgi:Flp pilus assembly protein TadG
MQSHRGSKQGQKNAKPRGQGLVEFAVSVVFLIILLAGVVDIGRAMLVYIELSDAAQEGAAYGAYTRQVGESISPIQTRIQARTRQSANRPIDLQSDPNVQVQVTLEDILGNGQWCAENRVTVQVSYQFQLSMPFMGAIIGSQSFPLTATVSNTIIRPPCP